MMRRRLATPFILVLLLLPALTESFALCTHCGIIYYLRIKYQYKGRLKQERTRLERKNGRGRGGRVE
jgi:hypothetical protein